MKFLKGFTLFALFFNAFMASLDVCRLILEPNIIAILLLLVNVLGATLMFNLYKGLQIENKS
jgi:hypothetical protein